MRAVQRLLAFSPGLSLGIVLQSPETLWSIYECRRCGPMWEKGLEHFKGHTFMSGFGMEVGD